MIKALLLTFKPTAGWNRVVQARRGVGFILVTYLLPLLLMVTMAESYGLIHWGKWQSRAGVLRKFTVGETIIYEAAQLLLTLAVVFICAYLVKIMGETFRNRQPYTQAFTAVAYGLSPMFLLRLLDTFPRISPWIAWGIGIALSIGILYQGLPRIMLPDPTHAFGLYLVSSIVLFLTTGLVRLLTALYLKGRVDFAHSYLAEKILHLVARLHL